MEELKFRIKPYWSDNTVSAMDIYAVMHGKIWYLFQNVMDLKYLMILENCLLK